MAALRLACLSLTQRLDTFFVFSLFVSLILTWGKLGRQPSASPINIPSFYIRILKLYITKYSQHLSPPIKKEEEKKSGRCDINSLFLTHSHRTCLSLCRTWCCTISRTDKGNALCRYPHEHLSRNTNTHTARREVLQRQRKEEKKYAEVDLGIMYSKKDTS